MIKRFIGYFTASNSQQVFVFGVFVALCCTAMVGEALRTSELQKSFNYLDVLLLLTYRTLQLIFLSYPHEDDLNWMLKIARVGLPLCVSWSIVAGFMSVFTARYSSLWLRWSHTGHIVIYGVSPQTLELIKNLQASSKKAKILLICSSSVEYFDNRHLACNRLSLIVKNPSILNFFKSIAIHKCEIFYIFEGTDSEKVHLLSQLASYLSKFRKSRSCLIAPTFFDRAYDLQRIVDGFDLEGLFSGTGELAVVPMNWRSEGARKILTSIDVSPDGLSYSRFPESVQAPKFALLGNDETLQEFLLQTLFHAHYQPHEVTQIHIVPTCTGTLDQWISTVCPFVRKTDQIPYCDDLFPTVRVHNSSFESPLDRLNLLLEQTEIHTLYVCMKKFDLALDFLVSASRLGLLESLDVVIVHESVEHNLERIDLNVRSLRSQSLTLNWACMNINGSTADKFPGHDLDRQAWAIHSHWPHPCDYTQWARESSRLSASHYLIKKRFFESKTGLAFTPENFERATSEVITGLAQIEHRRWSSERLVYGWRYPKDGRRDDKRRLHPNLLPFSMLSAEVQKKDVDAIQAALYSISVKV